MYGRRRKLSAEETAANAAKREARKQAAMTCQCCFNKILANGGVIAHHGYQRPGDGWQTASCFGARELPLEVSRKRLGHLIKILKNRLEAMNADLVKLQNDEIAVSKDFYDRKKTRMSNSHKSLYTTLEFTKANFFQVYEANKELIDYSSRSLSYYEMKAQDVKRRELNIKMVQDDIKNCEKVYSEWKQTHKRENEQWIKI